jgi:hypothetical protein
MSAPVVEYPHHIDRGYEITDDGTIHVYGKNVLIDQKVINEAQSRRVIEWPNPTEGILPIGGVPRKP